jgi:putative flippase GtrA
MGPAARSPSARLLDVRLFGRHQVAAVVATLVDFTMMVAFVELTEAPPPLATLLSASLGGMTNFALSRQWAFRARHRGSVASQAVRYGLVCAGGAILNAGLLAAVLALASPSYVVTRAIVSILVSLAYTYPMHTRVVFRVAETGAGAAR